MFTVTHHFFGILWLSLCFPHYDSFLNGQADVQCLLQHLQGPEGGEAKFLWKHKTPTKKCSYIYHHHSKHADTICCWPHLYNQSKQWSANINIHIMWRSFAENLLKLDKEQQQHHGQTDQRANAWMDITERINRMDGDKNTRELRWRCCGSDWLVNDETQNHTQHVLPSRGLGHKTALGGAMLRYVCPFTVGKKTSVTKGNGLWQVKPAEQPLKSLESQYIKLCDDLNEETSTCCCICSSIILVLMMF